MNRFKDMALVLLYEGDLVYQTATMEKDTMKKTEGFTLIEISITVSIIGLLAALAAIAVTRAHQSALNKQASGELQFLSASILQMAWDTGKWPNKALRTNPGSTEIWALGGKAVGLTQTDGSYNNWKGPYYEGSLVDPWGHPYFFDPDYLIKGVNHVVVGSFGPNGVGRNLYDSDDIYVLLDD